MAKKKVLVTKTKKKAAKSDGWVSSKDVKSKKVGEKRADRMEKRGWKKHESMRGRGASRPQRATGSSASMKRAAHMVKKVNKGHRGR